MPDDPTKGAAMVLYFLTACRFESETSLDPDAPVGWMPVFKTIQAARKYGNGIGEVGEIAFVGKKLQN